MNETPVGYVGHVCNEARMHWMSRLATIIDSVKSYALFAGDRHDVAHSMAVAPARHLQMSVGTLPFL